MTEVDFSSLPQKAPEFDLRELLEAGCHFGHHTKKWHPMMAEFIHMEKDQIHIFDLAKTAAQLQKAYNYAYDLAKNGKTLMVIGTKRQARDVVKEVALDAGMPYVNSRWLGGTITNWDQIKKSIKRMLDIERGLKDGEYDGLTKYERVQLEKEAGRLARFFDGCRELKGRPDAIFVIDPNREDLALTEANLSDIPVVALIDSNGDPREVTLPIPSNDDALPCIKLIVEAVGAGYKAGKSSSGEKPALKAQKDMKEEVASKK